MPKTDVPFLIKSNCVDYDFQHTVAKFNVNDPASLSTLKINQLLASVDVISGYLKRYVYFSTYPPIQSSGISRELADNTIPTTDMSFINAQYYKFQSMVSLSNKTNVILELPFGDNYSYSSVASRGYFSTKNGSSVGTYNVSPFGAVSHAYMENCISFTLNDGGIVSTSQYRTVAVTLKPTVMLADIDKIEVVSKMQGSIFTGTPPGNAANFYLILACLSLPI